MDTLKTMLMENNITFTDSIFNTEDGIGEKPFVSNIASVFVSLHVQSTLHSLVITHIQYPHTYPPPYTHTHTHTYSNRLLIFKQEFLSLQHILNMLGS